MTKRRYIMFGKLFTICVLVFGCLFGCFAFKVDVFVENNGIREMNQFEIVDEETPPFETSPGDGMTFEDSSVSKHSTHNEKLTRDFKQTETFAKRNKRAGRTRGTSSSFIYTGVKVTGIFGNAFPETQANRWKSCISRANADSSSNSVVTVEKGETVYLPCHDCESYDREKFEPRQWIKMDSSPNKDGFYRVREVVPDMHDSKNRNRVLINLDHTLHMKNIKRKDAGSYFCKPVGDSRYALHKRMSWTGLNDWLKNNVSLGQFYHLDVLDLNKESFVDVTGEQSSLIQEPEVLPHLNILVQTRWTTWSECSVCGEEGLRNRIGVCVVKKLNFRQQVPNMYLDRILDFANDGILCKSEYLIQFSNENWISRPNEVIVEECNTTCAGKTRQKRDISKPTPEILSDQKKKKKSLSKTLKAGEYLILVCPGSSIRKMATWVNGSKYLPLMKVKKSTNRRITFDYFGNLHFQHVIISDTGTYSCWIKKKLKRQFEIKVLPNFQHGVYRYLGYLCIVFGVDFVIFLFLACVKFINRKKQVRKRSDDKKKDAAISDSSSESENSG